MKTERVTLLVSPEFKRFLQEEAEREGVSLGELVRRRCERPAPSPVNTAAELKEHAQRLAALEQRVQQLMAGPREGRNWTQAVGEEADAGPLKRRPLPPP